MAAAAGMLALSGCAAGFHPQTTPSLQPRDGQNEPVIGYTSAIAIRHAFILGPAPDTAAYPAHGDAALYVSFVNQTKRSDKLLGVQTAAADQVIVGDRRSNAGPSPSPTPSSGRTSTGDATSSPTPTTTETGRKGRSPSPSATEPTSVELTIPASSSDVGAVKVGRPPYSDNTITLTGLTGSLDNGAVVKVTFMFERAGEMTLDVPVMPQTGPLESLSPAPTPSSSEANG